ncbi:hypothetical protein [Moorena sp. SIO3H5]|uniref:hypothetical protein n=1 Tax=Moorena sp. SIO3H5 TaxID=2607834 RepID=UPI0013011CFC|nr:hypothetical protein [Moorena sp. SIO3H5]NEO45538.1 hypothetical protein [Moorena sp. SIO4A3]NEO71724.1 hypothetical protein [Moorena sp. SIO3H5]
MSYCPASPIHRALPFPEGGVRQTVDHNWVLTPVIKLEAVEILADIPTLTANIALRKPVTVPEEGEQTVSGATEGVLTNTYHHFQSAKICLICAIA